MATDDEKYTLEEWVDALAASPLRETVTRLMVALKRAPAGSLTANERDKLLRLRERILEALARAADDQATEE